MYCFPDEISLTIRVNDRSRSCLLPVRPLRSPSPRPIVSLVVVSSVVTRQSVVSLACRDAGQDFQFSLIKNV